MIWKGAKTGRFRCKMSHVVCPLCGRSLSVYHYDPSEFDDDVMGQTFTGKGRGHGFEVSSRYSVLGDDEYEDLLHMMASRTLRIVKMFYDNGYLEKQDIIDTFTQSE